MRSGLRNFWYPVLPSADLADAPVAIQRLGEHLVAWRDEHNRAHMFLDRCSHRGAPLSLGEVRGSRLRCGYHGLEFDHSGRCRRVPFERADDGPLCESFRVCSYPCEEHAGYLWAFVHDGVHPDPVPRLELEPEIGSSDFECFLTTVHFQANWLTVLENQCDPGHAPILHGGSLFFPPDEGQVLDWFIPDPLPFRTDDVPKPSGDGTRPSVVLLAPSPYSGGHATRFVPPALVKIPLQLPDVREPTWVLQFHTPVDETATIGYWCVARRVASEAERQQWREQWPMFASAWRTVDEQDVMICEALESRGAHGGRALPQDGGISRVRRVLRHLADEKG